MANKCAHVLVEGKVQGVFFRNTARDTAKSLKVTGWIRNRQDGKVELLLEGDEIALDEMVEWCRQGPPGALIAGLEVEPQAYSGEFKQFRIRY